ncbi:MAG TPA: hypothetical protein VK175_02095 [Leadbetterella sp.]|nr:hypothetical protein [Leadbetterella sp.]
MIAKSLFSIISYKNKSQFPSAIDIAETSYTLLNKLSEFDNLFTYPRYYHNGKDIDLNLTNKTEFIETVSKQVLNKEWNEITKFEGEKKPDINYKRTKDGYSAWFKIVKDGSVLFDVSVGIGFNVDGITISRFNKDYSFSYEWYESICLIIINSMEPFYCVVRMDHQTVNLIYNEFKIAYPLGWFTYYSKELKIKIPDIPYLSIKPYHEGTLIKTDEIDFLADKESFEAYKTRLKVLLEKLK